MNNSYLYRVYPTNIATCVAINRKNMNGVMQLTVEGGQAGPVT